MWPLIKSIAIPGDGFDTNKHKREEMVADVYFSNATGWNYVITKHVLWLLFRSFGFKSITLLTPLNFSLCESLSSAQIVHTILCTESRCVLIHQIPSIHSALLVWDVTINIRTICTDPTEHFNLTQDKILRSEIVSNKCDMSFIK